MTAGLLTPLAKNVFLPFALSAGISAADAAIHKKQRIRNYSINNFKGKNEKYNEKS